MEFINTATNTKSADKIISTLKHTINQLLFGIYLKGNRTSIPIKFSKYTRDIIKYETLSITEIEEYFNTLVSVEITDSNEENKNIIGYYDGKTKSITIFEDIINTDYSYNLLYVFFHEFAHHINNEKNVAEKGYSSIYKNPSYYLEEIQADITARSILKNIKTFSTLFMNYTEIEDRIRSLISKYKESRLQIHGNNAFFHFSYNGHHPSSNSNTTITNNYIRSYNYNYNGHFSTNYN